MVYLLHTLGKSFSNYNKYAYNTEINNNLIKNHNYFIADKSNYIKIL